MIKRFETIIMGLTYDELVVFNNMAVDRIRLMQKAGALMHMAQFNVGDTVYWTGNNGMQLSGIIIRFNQKTVSIRTANAGQWNVSPNLLRK